MHLDDLQNYIHMSEIELLYFRNHLQKLEILFFISQVGMELLVCQDLFDIVLYFYLSTATTSIEQSFLQEFHMAPLSANFTV